MALPHGAVGWSVVFPGHTQLIFHTSGHFIYTNEPRHEISNNVVCATSKGSDQPAHTRSLIRAFASHLTTL